MRFLKPLFFVLFLIYLYNLIFIVNLIIIELLFTIITSYLSIIKKLWLNDYSYIQ